ncbi:MAG: hypothetical protein H0Z28_01945 [Archaeoglobus sp.]|nr:hypothetical protein [Archaeoglobus sp.]
MDKDFLMMFIFLISLISLTMYVNELGIPHEGVEAKFLDFTNSGEQLSSNQGALQSKSQNYNINSDPQDPDSQDPQNAQPKKFTVEILEIKETALLSREIKARLTNNYEDVKNVRVRFELKVDGQTIKINGKDYLTLILGNLKKGESVERSVEVNIDFFDGMKIKNKGYVDAIMTVIYEGGSETTSYRINL